MKLNKPLFIVYVTLVYAFAYLVAGAIAYQLITKQFYVGDHAIFTSYLRSESNPTEWAHTSLWIVPAVLLRGLLLAIVLIPFSGTLRSMTIRKRMLVLFGVVFLLMHMAAAAPSPSNIEGLVYMKPALMSSYAFWLTQPEMVLQSIIFAAVVAKLLDTALNDSGSLSQKRLRKQ